MCAWLRILFEHGARDAPARQQQRRRQPDGPAADDDYTGLNGLHTPPKLEGGGGTTRDARPRIAGSASPTPTSLAAANHARAASKTDEGVRVPLMSSATTSCTSTIPSMVAPVPTSWSLLSSSNVRLSMVLCAHPRLSTSTQ